MKKNTVSNNRGFTLAELTLSLGMVTLISAATFSGQMNLMLTASRDEVYQGLRDEVLLSLDHLERDISLSTNVYPAIGSAGNMRTTGDTTLVLRQPVYNDDNTIAPGAFQYVCYTIPNNSTLLVREEWADKNSMVPTISKVLNKNIVGMAFLYGGKTFTEVTDMFAVSEVYTLLIGGQPTGTPLPAGKSLDVSDVSDLLQFDGLVFTGLNPTHLPPNLDQINLDRQDFLFSSPIAGTTLRNHRAPLKLERELI